MSTQKSDEKKVEEPKVAATADAKAEAQAKDQKDWSDQLKKVAYAAVGAVNLSQDDVNSFVKRLVQKGEIAKKDGEKILKQFTDKVQQTVKRDARAVAAKVESAAEQATEKAQAAANQEKLAEKINASMERMLHTMNIATRKDVDELSRQLDELDRKVGELVDTASSRRKQVAGA